MDAQKKPYKVIQCETGIVDFNGSTVVDDLDELLDEVENAAEDIIYVEFNGTWRLSDFIGLVNTRGNYRIYTYYTMDYNVIYQYMLNFSQLIMEQINYADEIVYINKGESSQIKIVKKTIAGLKPWISYKELNSAKVR